jgi:hypothetical protein
MPRKPQNKNELMKAIEYEWELLMKAAKALSDEQMTTPDSGGWSPKDNLAHLAEWMNILMGYHMDKRPADKVLGVSEEVIRDWDTEDINRFLFERNKDYTRTEVLSHLKKSYKKLYTKLKAASFKDLMKPRDADDPQKRPLLLWILGNTTEHFKEHRKII